MQEEELIQKLVAGEENAYRYFIQENQNKLFKLCLGFLHNKEDAEDICQEVFIELLHSLQSFKGNSSVHTWLYRIAVNKSLNQLKKRKRTLLYNKMFKGLKLSYANKETPDKEMEKKELKGSLFQAIERLPENQRIAYTLAKYDEMSYEKIAGIMGISLASVESLMFRAKENLKKRLLNYYESNFK